MKIFLMMILAAGCILAPSYSFAEAEGTETTRALSSEEMKQWEENYKKQKVKFKELEGSEWEVQLVSVDEKKKKNEEKDRLVFKNGTVSLDSLTKKGYPAVGYTVTPNSDGEGAIWENFQETKEGSLAMRGEWNGEAMTGAAREIYDKGKKIVTYNFSSKKVAGPPADAVSGTPSQASDAAKPSTIKSSLVSLEKS